MRAQTVCRSCIGGAIVTALVTGFVARADVLYSNGAGTVHGGLITNLAAGFSGADASQASADVTSTGTTCSNTATILRRVGDDFTVAAGGWSVTSATVYAYLQSTAYSFPPTSPLNSITARIFNQVPADDTTGLVATSSTILSNAWTGVYVTQNGAANLGQNNKPLMAVTLDFGALSLGSGTYWITWTADGSLAGTVACIAPYVRDVDGAGLPTTPTGNARSLNRNNGTWSSTPILENRGGVALPFLINGSPAPAPASGALLGLAGLMAMRRRR